MKKILLSAILIATALTSFGQVGIGTNTPNVSAALDVESTTLGFLPPRMTSAEMTAITSPAEGLTVYCNDCTPKSLYFFNGTDYIAAVDGTVVSIPVLPPAIGDFRDGGVVFWVDPADNTKGLVCAVNDQAVGVEWACYGELIAGANGLVIGTGADNTAAIEFACTTTGTAVDIAANLTLNGFSDWFLPSKDELNEMYLNRGSINTTAVNNGGTNFMSGGNDAYWSSSQSTANGAWFQFISLGGNQGYDDIDNFENQYVRAVRAF